MQMRNPRHVVVRLFAICGIIVSISALIGALLKVRLHEWAYEFPAISVPTAMVLILYGICFCILGNGNHQP